MDEKKFCEYAPGLIIWVFFDFKKFLRHSKSRRRCSQWQIEGRALLGSFCNQKTWNSYLLITENVYVGLIELKVCWTVRKYVQQTFRKRFMPSYSREDMNLKQQLVNDRNQIFGRYRNFGHFGIGRNTTDTDTETDTERWNIFITLSFSFWYSFKI